MVSLRHCLAILSLLSATHAFADPGDPVAIRRWPMGVISIETMWDLNLVIDTGGKASQRLKTTADHVVSFSDDVLHVLHRTPNMDKVQWDPKDPQRKSLSNDVTVKSWRTGQKGEDAVSGGDPRAAAWAIQMSVDGISVLCVAADSLPTAVALDASIFKGQDVLLLNLNGGPVSADSDLAKFVRDVSPRYVIVNPMAATQIDMAAFHKSIALKGQTTVSPDNTLAVSATDEPGDGVQFLALSDQPRIMPAELAELFQRMEHSCEASQQVFAKLSTGQMNWKPSNGTHTPRWNTEHMMGRQLLFFSQIYHAIDPAIPALNLNPKQMPEDYQYAHADWSGAEEARQMQRVSRFARRFSYLINDLDVDKRAPGSRWPSLKTLLLQMERHYSEHTANTVKKFDLPDWPGK